MGEVVLATNVSVDGQFEGPDGDISWHRVDDELHTHFNEELRRAAAFVDGRVTWQLMADFWPTADEDPSADGPMREFAAIWREKPKVVVSRTLTDAGWGTQVWRDVDADSLRALAADGDVAVGGAVLARTLVERGLLDRVDVYVHPMVLGAGRPLFPTAGVPTSLRLTGTREFGNGVVLHRYAVGGAAG
ncbi:dihydrofolate reductase family protein [Actinotalea sp. AC32]|nr:dihydrofolate reductase family protein [Actinotalea sp. AC32]